MKLSYSPGSYLFATVFCLGLILHPIKVVAKEPTETERIYQKLFFEYFDLIRPSVENKNIKEIDQLTEKFRGNNQSQGLAMIYIWDRNLKAKNNLLFHMDYQQKLFALPKIQWKLRATANVYQGDGYVLVDYESNDSVIQFRLVFSCDTRPFKQSTFPASQ